MPRKKLKILLIEPNYSNKYPPIGLMKLSTYHKNLGHEVVFYKGELKQFVIEQIAQKCIIECLDITNSINWLLYKDFFIDYIKTRKKEFLSKIPIKESEMEILITNKINEYKDYYHKNFWEKNPEWDRVFVTTLFTFYWKTTIETINFAKKLFPVPLSPISKIGKFVAAYFRT